MPRKLKPGYSKAGSEYVNEKTSYLIEEEGLDPSRAYAQAHSMARALHLKVPPPPIRTIKGKKRPMRR